MEYARLNAGKLGLAAALAVILIWILLLLIGWLTGGAMMWRMGAGMGVQMTEEGIGESARIGSMMLFPSLLASLFAGASAGVMTWLTASIYNRLL